MCVLAFVLHAHDVNVGAGNRVANTHTVKKVSTLKKNIHTFLLSASEKLNFSFL